MINRKDLLSLGFYKKSPYTGSDGKMCFRLEKTTVTEPEEGDRFLATVWKGPFAFAHTTEEKITHLEDFTDEGLDKSVDWLNEEAALFNRPED